MRLSMPKRKASGVGASAGPPSRAAVVRSERPIRSSRCWKYSTASCADMATSTNG